MYLEDKNFFEQEEKNVLEIILSNQFPFYWMDQQTLEDNRPFLGHTFWHRNTHEPCSHFCDFVENIVKKFCIKNNIGFKKILRGSVNLSFPLNEENYKPAAVHQDYDFDHKQMLIYLNDSDGDTILYDKETKKITNRITPEKFKIICFDNVPHVGLGPTKSSRRVVLVICFN